jgi:hypothetical protein
VPLTQSTARVHTFFVSVIWIIPVGAISLACGTKNH